MYAKVFSHMYDGTLCTRGPWQALVTFQQLLVLANQHGEVDMTADAVSRRTTIPMEIIKIGIDALLQDDPDSRTPDENGKRIVPLVDGRSWGWRIVNYIHYRSLKREEDRREYHRKYYREKRSTNSTQLNTAQHAQPIQPIAEANAVNRKERNIKERKVGSTFDTFLAQCKAKGEKAISDYKPIMDFTNKIGLPMDFTVLCWDEFKRRHSKGGLAEGKRYADWRRAFRNCLEGNWYRLWYFDQGSGKYVLTSNGVSADRATA